MEDTSCLVPCKLLSKLSFIGGNGKLLNLCEDFMTHSQLLEGLKCEPKYKTTKEGGVGARSLAHNTLRGRGVCWSFGMGLRRVDKLQSLTRAYTQPTQSG
jgi:hypothetical protein